MITNRRAARPEERAFEHVVAETRALFQRLKLVAEQVHGQGEASATRRGVLQSLARLGPQTVPSLARTRGVSRQYLQSVVDELLEERLVELVENPAHRRSSLVALVAKGRACVRAMEEREAKLMARFPLGVTERELRQAASVLARVRSSFESLEWLHAVDARAPRRRATGRRPTLRS